MYPVVYVVERRWLQVVLTIRYPLSQSLPALDGTANQMSWGTKRLVEQNVGESLQQGQHVVFNDGNNCRTHLSPNVQLQIQCSCGADKAAKYTTMRDLERETPTVVQFWYAVNGTR